MSAPRTDRRYKNPAKAPLIVSEKRLTFFLPEDTFRALRLHTGFFQVANVEGAGHPIEDEPLPETPPSCTEG